MLSAARLSVRPPKRPFKARRKPRPALREREGWRILSVKAPSLPQDPLPGRIRADFRPRL